MSPLRQRMLEDMRVRNFTEGTQKAYVSAVAGFARHFWRSPAELGPEHVREYLVYLTVNERIASAKIVYSALPLYLWPHAR
jgi:integrase/recombinase XerD